MLYEYLCSNYKPNEPIFVADVSLPVSNVNLRQMFKILCDSGKIRRFDTGVYYIPKESRLKGGVPLGADTVARYKYISRNGRVDGYYSGYTFANQLGVTTQVPYMVEIVSNFHHIRNLSSNSQLICKGISRVISINFSISVYIFISGNCICSQRNSAL